MYVGDRRLQKEPHTDYWTKKPVPGGEYANYYIENDHEGIIGREMLETVQARLKQEEERKANDVISEEDLFKALSEHLGIKWKGVEAVTENTFDQIKKVVLFNDGRIEIEMEDAA